MLSTIDEVNSSRRASCMWKISCVAFICKVDYKSAKSKYFKGLGNSYKTGYLCRDMAKALQRAGMSYKSKYVKHKSKFKENSIVFIKRSKRYLEGHYLAKSKNDWMDPWINFKANKPVLSNAKAGFRKRLPDRAIYVISAI